MLIVYFTILEILKVYNKSVVFDCLVFSEYIVLNAILLMQ